MKNWFCTVALTIILMTATGLGQDLPAPRQGDAPGWSVTLAVDFEDTAVDKNGVAPADAKNLQFVEGKSGKGLLLRDQVLLSYLTAGIADAYAGRIEFWFKPNWEGAEKKTRTLFVDDDSYLRLLKSEGGQICFQAFRVDWQQALALGLDVQAWKPEAWRHVAVRWSADEKSLLTLDETTRDGWLTFGNSTFKLGAKLYIGARPGDGAKLPADGVIDELRMYRLMPQKPQGGAK
ncbi:MAG: hypothetical protein HY360_11395 [Verrucomicrobia bacterium]|nr:hypothetical protein [Verrucomicrobiota bacterium]